METAKIRKIKATVAEIAARAGVSTATVDRVIHNRPGVKPHTVTHIRTVIDEMESVEPEATGRSPAGEQYRFDVILPEGPNSFFNALEDELGATPGDGDQFVSFNVRRIEGFNPRALAESILQFGRESDGIVVVAIEDPLVRDAVNRISDAGIPVVTLVSDLSNARHQAYIGLDNRAAGRTAGYLMARFAPERGSVLLIAGSMSLRDHEEREIGFRRVLGERNDKLEIISRLEDHDDYRTTYAGVQGVLQDHPELVGIYNIGAGNRGIANALEAGGRGNDIVFIGHELTPYSRQYLIEGIMDAVIDQNPKAEVRRLREVLRRLGQDRLQPVESPPGEVRVFFRENLP